MKADSLRLSLYSLFLFLLLSHLLPSLPLSFPHHPHSLSLPPSPFATPLSLSSLPPPPLRHRPPSLYSPLSLQAAGYKLAVLPVAGALLGGVLAGPIGLLAGFKAAGLAAAVGGGALGFAGGNLVQKHRKARVDQQMRRLMAPPQTESDKGELPSPGEVAQPFVTSQGGISKDTEAS